MSTAANVTTGKRRVDGGIYVADAGATLPTDASTALDSAFKNLGYVSEDGVTNSLGTETTDIKEWGGHVVDVVDTDQTDEFKYKLIESLNVDVLKTIFGADNVTVTQNSGDIAIQVKGISNAAKVYVIDMAMKGGRLKRIVIPSGKITGLGDVVYKNNEAVAYDLTIKGTLDSSGNSHYEYITGAA